MAEVDEATVDELPCAYAWQLEAEIRAGTLTSTKLSQCLSNGLDLNAPMPPRSIVPIHLAAHQDKPDCVRLLIAAGAEPNLRAKDSVSGETALLFAARKGRTQNVIALLRAGADPNLASLSSGLTALVYMAARGSVQGVAALLAAGADADVVDTASAGELTASMTPMRAAIMTGNPNVLPTLLRGGAGNCIGHYEGALQKILNRNESDDDSDDDSRTAREGHRAALIYLHWVAKAGGYRKYERMRRAAVMAMVVPNSKLPDALRIWVEHVADSFPDPLEERRPSGARVRLSP